MQQPDADDILLRTLFGVEEDLEDMRDALAGALEDYEDALGQLTTAIPEWAMVDAKALRAAWRMHTPPLSHTVLGPRAVATIASQVELFLNTWLGTSSHPKHEKLSRDTAHHHACTLAIVALKDTLAIALTLTRDHAKEVREGINALGEEIMFDLDERREHSRQALEELIATGDVEQGRAARQELAMLWEEQRERAKGFEDTWAALVGHLNLGEEITIQGTETLKQMIDHVHANLPKAPPLRPTLAQKTPKPPATTPPPEDAPSAFDPYGGQLEEPPIPEESAPRRTGRTKLLAQAKRKQKLDTFFEEPVQENDDLVFEDQSPDPMIDFFEEAADEADSISNSLLFTPEDEAPSAVSSSPTRSPYDVFLSEDSSPQRLPEDSAPSLPSARPLSILPADLFVEEDIFTQDTDPGAHKPRPEPSPPEALRPGPRTAARDVDDASFQTAPMGKWARDQDYPLPPAPTPAPVPEPPERREPQRAPLPSSTPEVATSQKAQAPPQPEDALPAKPETQGAGEALLDEDDGASRVATKPAPTKPAVRTASLSGKKDQPVETTRAPLLLEGSAHRVRVGWAPLSRTETVVGQVVPFLLLVCLLGVSALSDPTAYYYPLRTGSIPHIVSWLLLMWLLLGPWVLRWRVTWQGWRPVVLKRTSIHDEAQLLLDVPQVGEMELGPWRLERRAVKEVSRSRWRSSRDEGQGWLLTLVEGDGRMWNFSTREGELERDWSFSSLPVTTLPDDTWSLRAEIFESLERWMESATHL